MSAGVSTLIIILLVWPSNDRIISVVLAAYNAPTPSFIILHLLVRKLSCWQTHKQTPLRTSNALRYATTLGNKQIPQSFSVSVVLYSHYYSTDVEFRRPWNDSSVGGSSQQSPADLCNTSQIKLCTWRGGRSQISRRCLPSADRPTGCHRTTSFHRS